MKKIKFLINFLLIVILTHNKLIAQELNVNVEVITAQVMNVDKKIFETLRSSIRDFMNNTRWTQDEFLNHERIEATLLINIKEVLSQTDFKATCQIQTRRPVYKSSYSSNVLSYLDENFDFRYVEYQPFEFNGTTFNNDLTAMIAFYAYMIIGFDYDTFSPEGGTPYFQIAQGIVNNAQNSGNKGWSSLAKGNDKYNNRYWLVENTLNPAYKPIRQAYYQYHLKGLDVMWNNPEEGRKQIYEALLKVQSVFKLYPVLLYNIIFFNAKSDELVNIYSGATSEEKTKVVELLSEIDAAKSNKYQTRIK
jgi:hypothetical protein